MLHARISSMPEGVYGVISEQSTRKFLEVVFLVMYLERYPDVIGRNGRAVAGNEGEADSCMFIKRRVIRDAPTGKG